MANTESLLEVSEICEILHLGKSRVYTLIKEELPYIKIGKKILVKKVALDKYIDQRTKIN